jgi:Tfp pilus assembly PilM family ATPase
MSLAEFFQTAPPDVAVEIDADHVAAARVTWRGADATVAAHTVETVAPGLVVPALAVPNIQDVPGLGRAIAAALSRLGGRARRVALVIPDTVGKVTLVKFERVPGKVEDLQELVRWQIKKSAPFPLDQAVVSFTPGVRYPDGSQEFIVAAARQDVIEQYEQACVAAGAYAGLVDLATFSLINGVLGGSAAPSGDWLLVHVTQAYTTLTVIRDGHVIFFRNRDNDDEGTLADVVHQTAMYYEDRLRGGGFTRVLLAGAATVPGGAEALRRNLEERLGLTVESVDPRTAAALRDRIIASPELLDALAPLVGILLRERKVAA